MHSGHVVIATDVNSIRNTIVLRRKWKDVYSSGFEEMVIYLKHKSIFNGINQYKKAKCKANECEYFQIGVRLSCG